MDTPHHGNYSISRLIGVWAHLLQALLQFLLLRCYRPSDLLVDAACSNAFDVRIVGPDATYATNLRRIESFCIGRIWPIWMRLRCGILVLHQILLCRDPQTSFCLSYDILLLFIYALSLSFLPYALFYEPMPTALASLTMLFSPPALP
ncbi:hypothetical protein BKA70DRAFT_266797 [Coprinopsis sp. MPI-PUGE-AT-0042]|nr:hypothetical protein BKA70DRAFT_266797 [Coprinopsis sp. MPI-PUGE-AT-0042]